LILRPGFHDPLLQWLFLLIVLVAGGSFTGILMGDIDRLRLSERAVRAELAELNADLEFRVDEQVAELERLGRLRLFLSPQVAEAVLDEHDSGLTTPHRQLIAVVFADLRGFTRFSASTEPEDVMEILDTYYG